MTISLQQHIEQLGKRARIASRIIAIASDEQKASALKAIAKHLRQDQALLFAANRKDLSAAESNGLSGPMLDRLKLSERTLESMASGLEQIAAMSDPIGEILHMRIRPNGMQVGQMRVPLGVIGIIYESRPNVTIDAAALCLKSGNACILRGGSEAIHSNTALAEIIRQGLRSAQLPDDVVQVVDTTDRAAVGLLATLTEYIDVIVPRGGKGLIERLSQEARVPLIKHLDGNCHVFVDDQADLKKALDIVVNAKTYRYGICGSLETLLVHQAVAAHFLPAIAAALKTFNVELRGCARTQTLLPEIVAATEEDWFTEYLAPILAVRIVDTLEEAIQHIETYGSQHTDAIVTEAISHANRFIRAVDSSSVLVNLPTCFADGFEYGLGAEIGISTNKLHARGPVGLEGLTTLKWVLIGDGQIRQ